MENLTIDYNHIRNTNNDFYQALIRVLDNSTTFESQELPQLFDEKYNTIDKESTINNK